jgi:LytS/YehU family sensor histidine kinase
VFVLAQRWPLGRGRLLAHGVLHVVAALLFCVAWAGLGAILRMLVDPGAVPDNALRGFLSWLFTTLPFGLAVYFGMVGIEHAIRYFDAARDQEMKMVRLNEQLTSARLLALQAQLSPHFLFNSLNTVAVLVREGKGAAATAVVEHLSEVLRTTLSSTTAPEHALSDEIELVRQYLAVEEARFSDRLRSRIAVPSALMSAAVPRFAVQHLVENAIRHGIARRFDAGLVELTARRVGDLLEIAVRDDGPGIDDAMRHPPGHGIENTRERLRTMYGSAASLRVTRAPAGGVMALLTIPYRELLLERGKDVS